MITLRQARIERGWSQSRAIAELQRHARSLGLQLPSAVSLKTELSRWENGHRSPDAFYRRLFELAYGCSATDLGLGQVEETLRSRLLLAGKRRCTGRRAYGGETCSDVTS